MSSLGFRSRPTYRLTATILRVSLYLMKGNQDEPIVKFDEELGKTDFEELYRTQRRYRNIGSIFMIILFLAILVFLGIRYYQRQRSTPVLPEEEKTPGQNIFIPGIDYQRPTDEGD